MKMQLGVLKNKMWWAGKGSCVCYSAAVAASHGPKCAQRKKKKVMKYNELSLKPIFF